MYDGKNLHITHVLYYTHKLRIQRVFNLHYLYCWVFIAVNGGFFTLVFSASVFQTPTYAVILATKNNQKSKIK